jgi:perosamine synthetase
MAAAAAERRGGAAAARKVPVLPVLTAKDLMPRRHATEPSILEVGQPIFVRYGASAIRLALEHSALRADASVLVPAFNCHSMVAPILAAGGRPCYYGIRSDLRIARADIERSLERDTHAVLLPHLFGRIQDLTEIRALCTERGIILIEDCAHSLFGSTRGASGPAPVGSVGDYAIASPRKFFAVPELGILTSARRSLAGLALSNAGARECARRIFDSVDDAVSAGHLIAMSPLVRAVKLATHFRRADSDQPLPFSRTVDADLRDPRNDSSRPRRQCGLSEWSLKWLMTADATERRRRHWQRFIEGLSAIQGYQVLDVEPGDSFVPYMVPVLLGDASRQFTRLKDLGVPIWRWEHSARGYCEVTDAYSHSLIQIPCHQALTEDEIDWMLRCCAEAAL